MTFDACAFFEKYRQAFASFDEIAISRFFNFPNLIVNSEGSVVTETEEQMRSFMTKLFQFYSEKEVTDPRVLSLLQTEPSPWLVQVSITWGMFDEQAQLVVRFHTTYTVQRIGHEWKIVFIIAHDEPQAFEEADRETCYIGEVHLE